MAYRIDEDSVGDPSIFFRVILKDEAFRGSSIADITWRVSRSSLDDVGPFRNWGCIRTSIPVPKLTAASDPIRTGNRWRTTAICSSGRSNLSARRSNQRKRYSADGLPPLRANRAGIPGVFSGKAPLSPTRELQLRELQPAFHAGTLSEGRITATPASAPRLSISAFCQPSITRERVPSPSTRNVVGTLEIP